MIVETLIVVASIGSLNVTLGFIVATTPAAPFDGTLLTTVGGVVSGAGPVAKIEVNVETRPFPARSVTPETVTVNDVLNAS